MPANLSFYLRTAPMSSLGIRPFALRGRNEGADTQTALCPYHLYISIGPVLTLTPTSHTETYGNVVNFTCQTNGTQLVWSVNSGPVNTNNDISVYTTNTSNGILSVLTIKAVPINVGNEVISIACILTAPVFIIKSATLTIKGTDISLYNIY